MGGGGISALECGYPEAERNVEEQARSWAELTRHKMLHCLFTHHSTLVPVGPHVLLSIVRAGAFSAFVICMVVY